jgi:hypothetical protein
MRCVVRHPCATQQMRETLHMRWILYQRDDCHLCDLALQVLAAVRAPEFDSVFIDGDEALEARYGVRVPVLRDDADGRELDWPFDAAAAARFLARDGRGDRATEQASARRGC